MAVSRPRPHRRAAILVGAVLALALAGPAAAGQAGFGVGLRVLPAAAAGRLAPALPVPPGALALTGDPAAGGWVHAASVEAVERFYLARMAALGYRLASSRREGAGARQVWEAAGGRVELHLQRTLGADGATWIRMEDGRA